MNLRKDSYDVYIGRGSKWGNPYILGKDGDRQEVVELYKDYLQNRKDLLSQVHELKGKKLGCYCKPQACHGDILKELADAV